jgi:hypothetical protein
LAVAPVVVTDLSAAVVVGLERRSFRERVRDLEIPHVRRGQRTLDVEVLREVLATASTREVDDAPAGIEGDADENPGPTASELLQRLDLSQGPRWLRGKTWDPKTRHKNEIGDLRTAGITRSELFERTASRQPIRLHDL